MDMFDNMSSFSSAVSLSGFKIVLYLNFAVG